MVHLRLNEKIANPNPYINFITALPAQSPEDERAALDLLRALAAQVKPIMKSHGLTINSLEEYPPNPIFAGRNWNAGEVIELVLRRPSPSGPSGSGSFYPTQYLLNTLCHELAHIKHMHHLPSFQREWAGLWREVEGLRRGGYRGDGMWSGGVRVGDGEAVSGIADDLPVEDLPEFTCGGAQSKERKKGSARRRRVARIRRATGQQKTGAQTERRRKPGRRVRAEVFGEGGSRLDGRELGEKEGSTRGRRAGARSAREARAEAAERRLRALAAAGSAGGEGGEESETEYEEDEEDEEGDDEPESDDESRRAGMLRQMKLEELALLRTDTAVGSSIASSSSGTGKANGGMVIDLTEEEDELPDMDHLLAGEDFVTLPSNTRAHTQPSGPSHPPPLPNTSTAKSKSKSKSTAPAKPSPASSSFRPQAPANTTLPPTASQPKSGKRPLAPLLPDVGDPGREPKRHKQNGLGALVAAEMRQRKSESLGLGQAKRLGGAGAADAGRRLGGEDRQQRTLGETLAGSGPGSTLGRRGRAVNGDGDGGDAPCGKGRQRERVGRWACGVCTFLNDPLLGRCEMCNVGERP